MAEQTKEKRDVVFAIFLVFIGSLFLLNTTGVVGWGIWEYILRFWPVFLILGGIRLILSESVLTEIIISITALTLFVLIGIFSYISFTSNSLSFIPDSVNEYILEDSNWLTYKDSNMVEDETFVNAEDYRGVTKRNLDIKVGASEFTLNDNEEDKLLELNSKYIKNHIEPSLKSKKVGDIVDISFDTISPNRITFWDRRKSPEFNFTLGKKDLVTDINIILGAGKGEVDLELVKLNKVSAQVGAGQMTIKLNESSIPSKLDLEVGAGNIILMLPENIGYKLSYDLGVGEITQNNEKIAEFLGRNSEYKSENYQEAEIKLEIVAKVGVGSLEINNI